MRIVKATLTPLRLELLQPLKTARGTYSAREGFLVRLEDEEGRVGLGEAMPLPEFGTESLPVCGEVLAAWLSSLEGQFLGDTVRAVEDTLSPFPPTVARGEGVRVRARHPAPPGPVPAAEHALELALLDLLARRQGVPLCWLLAEEARPEVLVNALLGGETAEALVDEARVAVAEGYGTLKLKVGGRALEEDEQRVKAVREAVGPDVKLRLDANGGWSELEAKRALDKLGWYQLELVEQPTPADDLAALWRVQRRAPCMVAADESLGSPETLRALLGSDPLLGGGPAVGAVVLKPMVLGGLLPGLVVAMRAARLGMQAYVTSSLDGVVARAGAAHLAAALPSGALASGLAVGKLFKSEPAVHDYRPLHGRIRLPETPGLGLDAGAVV
ncbi:mandelate racemase/muconate lactonizing enzyme family protein [Myxococcus sp. MISCRS1]|uniref:mandelate racemase/muconate lactonizing enzyme family protein n=1 Tax=Myxococcus TaxID=32 RepID=UPI001CC0D12A|nr:MULTISPECIES: mandelate racemase/muconate lactonizing enzyme family protein [unclassified Myxococcus]MBZ4398028.1 mandelate racemase/muconate lactonizing enzyme family protein [Myxococcus sp. AS-1-15]MBZ4409288.1 mandelate racemase/muconate lactonizing enzyme family protein [Myxococcus sp. XM-1-1-1]MCY1003454.1 mandelate racemase/muconate lactonizing enzyme family protein [Myxococcus sp. MISCRS1]BDT34936.1 mandelate racemase/muconate lactonizing enzyme family protein [Myxococcus sp. MH1]